MARTLQQTKKEADKKDQSLIGAFFGGFFTPVRLVGRGLAWIGTRPPLKQIGHALRWFFTRKFFKVLGRIVGFSFVRGSWRELKQATWPSFKMSLQLTWAVIIFAVVFGALIAVVDFGLDKLFKQLLLK